jgi:hypothetical protein
MTAPFSAENPTATRTILINETPLPTYLANVDSLSSHSKAAAQSAAKLRQRLDRSQNLYKIFEVYNAVVNLLSPVTKGASEIPVDATQLMVANSIFTIDNKPVIDSKIDVVSRQGGLITLNLASNKQIKIEMSENIIKQTYHDAIFYLPDGTTLTIKNFDNPASPNWEVLDLLMGITGYMADGMIAASSLDRVKYCDAPPNTEAQKKYAQKLDDTFSRLCDGLSPVETAVAPKETKTVEPIPGLHTVVGSALAGLQTELKSQGKPELVQDFIDFISDPLHDLRSVVDSLWDFSDIQKIYENSSYFKYGEAAEQRLSDAIAKESGSPNGIKYLSKEQRKVYLAKRNKIFPAFNALKGMLITANLAKKVNFAEMGKDYETWSNKLDLNYYFEDIAKCLTGNSITTALNFDVRNIM